MYTNDKKAPRMRKAEFSEQVVTKELWKEFTKSSPEYKKMKLTEFKALWAEISETIRKETITNPLGVKLGSYTGELKLQFLHWKHSKAVSPKLSEQLGKPTNHVNILTRGKVAKIKWERRWAVKFNRILQFYAFVPTRELHSMAKEYTDANSEKLRMTRCTLGGYSVWRQLKYRKK